MQQRFERLAEMLAAADPPAAVELLLRLLTECTEATGGAALSTVTGRLILQAVRTPSPGLVAAACEAWPSCQEKLKAGGAIVGEHHTLLPLLFEGELAGVLYLETGRPFDLQPLAPFLSALAKAVSNAGWSVRSHPDERSLLRRILEQSEWNVSQTARALGVTRRTVYLRMRRLKIPRRKRTEER